MPSPFNLFQTLAIDPLTGHMSNTPIRPRPGDSVDFSAAMDALIAVSACPDLTVGGKPVEVTIFDG